MISIKNVTLPNKPLNTFELVDAAGKLKIPYFRGVFLLDTLPRKPNKKECGISKPRYKQWARYALGRLV